MVGAIKRDGVTAKQAQYIEEYRVFGSPTVAAARAGYAHPEVAGFKLDNHPVVGPAARKAFDAEVWALGGLVVASLRRALTPGETMARGATIDVEIRNESQARDQWFRYTKDSAESQGKEIQDMTADELQAQLDRLKARREEIAGMAIDVTPDPEDSGIFG